MTRSRGVTLKRALASTLASVVVAAAAVVGVATPAHADRATPTLSAPEAPRAGGTITLSGTGWDSSGFGLYLGVRAAGTSADTYTVWIDDANTAGAMPGLGATAPMTPEGDFTVAVTVPAFADGVTQQIVIRGAHGQPSVINNLTQDIAYEAAPATPTTTTLAAGAATVVSGTPVTLTATVTPADAAGTVDFGAAGSAPVSGGSAAVSVTPAVGAHTYTATFTPSDTAVHTGSVSSAVTVTVTAAQPAPAPEPEKPSFDPALTVFLADGVTAYSGQPVYDGDVLVVKGSGFDPAGNVGGYGVPLPRGPQGSYVVFGSFLDSWKPSEGAASAARKATDQKWAMSQDVFDSVPSTYVGAISAQLAIVAADGTFSTTLTAKDFSAALEGGNWGVYSYGAGGVKNADQELAVAIDYRGEKSDGPAETPDGTSLTIVSPTGDLDPNVDNVITVAGAGFSGASAAFGAYVAFGPSATWDGQAAFPQTGWLDVQWITPAQISGGAFTTTFTVAAGTLNSTEAFQFAASAAHAYALTDRSLDAFVEVPVAAVALEPAIKVTTPLITPGGDLTVTGVGFPAGEQVSVTVHSDPFLLGTATVESDGSFTVTGTLPTDFAAGDHTVTATAGDVERSIAISVITPAVAAPAETAPVVEKKCVAQSAVNASFSWGVKSSFVTYINGSIAKGSSSIGWGGGSGAFNAEENRGAVSFGGSARFTGHNGLLDVALSNPRVVITGANTATLYVNVTSAGYGGNASVNASGVPFATLWFPDGSLSASGADVNGASATLTAAGAAAFMGFYGAGDALDSVSFSFGLGGEVECDSSTSGALAATGSDAPSDLLWAAFALLALGIGVLVRRRTAVRGR